ncbi:MAG: DnaJ domain protein [Edafosvirus sp.]|uniref:DnaJ domain protein n=1 Tax=Edafosvirus sp. TaxID=2487765 RepID=A0A3G4ZTJ6_9VIRU|nr:MAG: DnaJ domain protein [Edafosvirus sp.]
MSDSKKSDESYYDILGVDKKATTDAIRKAYKVLSKKWHPDKNLDNQEEATAMFKKITEAHETLADAKKRDIYDKYGKKGLSDRGMGFDPSQMNDILGQMFGGRRGFGGFPGFGGGFGGRQEEEEDDSESTGPIQFFAEATLSELFTGKHASKTFKRYSLCEDCKGTGSADGVDYTCDQCHGKKIVTVMKKIGPNMLQQIQQPCNKCNATGTTDTKDGTKVKKCPTCKGKKKSSEDYTLEYDIPKGAYDRYVIKIKNEGNEIPVKQRKSKDETRTQVIVVISEAPHDVFIRKFAAKGNNVNNANILIKMEISLAEAICGVQRKITHLDGKSIPVDHSDIIYEGDVYIIEGQGMPYINKTTRGDLYIQFTIKKEKDKEKKEELTFADKKKIWKLLTKETFTLKEKATTKFPLISMNDHRPSPTSDDDKEDSDNDDNDGDHHGHHGPNECPTQ